MVKQEKITHIGGKLFYKIFLSGGNKILENQALLNSINVFPIPDADTGSNLATSLKAIIDSAQPDKSFHLTAKSIAKAALIGSRGNSGVIFAQFFYGISIETEEVEDLSILEFASAIKKSVEHVYGAISDPIEGTILTVFKDWSDFIYSKKNLITDFTQLFIEAYEVANHSLSETTNKNKKLKKSNVVDAGAKGFVLFLEGVMEGIRKKASKSEIIVKTNDYIPFAQEILPQQVLKYRFCSEALLKAKKINHAKLKESIKSLGDSLIIAGSDQLTRIHIHTNEPHILFEKLGKFGTISYQKALDMLREKENIDNRKWKIAIVTDSTSDLPAEIIDFYQIHFLPFNINFGENRYLDKLTIKPDQFFKYLKQNKSYPIATQPDESTFIELYTQLAHNYDSIISVHLTKKFSGTYNSAVKAAEIVKNKSKKNISVLDSMHVSGSLGLLTLKIAEAIEKDVEHEKIIEDFEEWKHKSRIYVSVKNMKNLVKGGRVSPIKSIIGRMLNLKPIVSFDLEGAPFLFDKAYTQKVNMKKVMKHTEKFLKGKKLWNYQVLHAEREDTAQWFTTEMTKLTGKKPLSVLNISPVIGLSAGKGTVAISLMVE